MSYSFRLWLSGNKPRVTQSSLHQQIISHEPQKHADYYDCRIFGCGSIALGSYDINDYNLSEYEVKKIGHIDHTESEEQVSCFRPYHDSSLHVKLMCAFP